MHQINQSIEIVHPTLHRCGNEVSVGKQKLVKNNQDNQIQTNFVQYVFFRKRYRPTQGTMGSGAGEFSRIFVLKVTLQFVRLLFTGSYRKKLGEQDVLVAPPIISLREQLLPC